MKLHSQICHAYCHPLLLTLTYLHFAEQRLVIGFCSIWGIIRPLHYWNFIHTAGMTQPAHCHWMLVTLTYFSHLAKQCLVCMLSHISRTQRRLCYWPWPTFYTCLTNVKCVCLASSLELHQQSGPSHLANFLCCLEGKSNVHWQDCS